MYPDFDYTPGNGAVHEWQRLCRFLGVDPEDNDQYLVRATRRNIRTALVRQFNHRYGEDASDLAAWQALCLVAGIAIPPTLEECEEVRAAGFNDPFAERGRRFAARMSIWSTSRSWRTARASHCSRRRSR